MLSADHPDLAPMPHLALARRILLAYSPTDPSQLEMRRRTLELIERHPVSAHRRNCREGHLTASALVLDPPGERVLLTHHKKLGRWLQLGGHCDGDANLVGVAWREATEESGIEGLAIDPRVVDVDIHRIPERRGEPEHLHYDTRFFIRAPRGAAPVASDESHAVRWMGIEEALRLDLDASLRRLLSFL